jgi:hypothetical protein
VASDPAGDSDGLPPSPFGPPSYGPSGQPMPPATPGVPGAPVPPGVPVPPGYGPPSYGPSYGPPSYGPPPYGRPGYFQPGMRAADADRERTLDALRAAYGEGRLTKEEFDARSAAAMAARTYSELTALVADVPVGPVGQAPLSYQPPGGYYPAPQPPANGLAGASLVCSIIGLLMPLLLIPGVVMGHVARDQIRAKGQRGDGMALAGLVIGYLGAAFWALIIVIAATRG